MLDLLGRLLATIVTFGSLVGLVASLKDHNEDFDGGQWFLIALATVLGLLAVGLEIGAYVRRRPWVKKPEKVPAFMRGWINDAGRVAIFSRDMSWVDAATRALLEKKARNGELVLVLPNSIEISRALSDLGAQVIHYPELGYTIKSRFTIVNLERPDTAVAIGYRVSEGKHRIDRFRAGEDPAFYLAQDLLELISRFGPKMAGKQ